MAQNTKLMTSPVPVSLGRREPMASVRITRQRSLAEHFVVTAIITMAVLILGYVSMATPEAPVIEDRIVRQK
jgi:hypothetical protein